MSTQVVRVQGFSKGSLKNIGNEVDRAKVDHRNQDIDSSLSYLNHSYKDAPNGMFNEWNDVLTSLKVEVKIRKDAVAFEGMVITSDKEFFEKFGYVRGEPAPKAVIEFFDRAYEFAKQQVGFQGTDRNFLSAKVHFDETTPHLQLYYVPVTDKWREKVYQRDAAGHVVKNDKGVPQQAKGEDGKTLFKPVECPERPHLSRSEFWRIRGGNTSYRKMQDLFHKVVGKSYNLERGEIGSDREHLTKAQWEQKQIVAEKEQLTAVVEPYREMRAEIDKVDIQGKKNLFGGVVVKQDELETLVKHAKAYAANKNKIDNYETRQKAVADKEHDLNLREVKTNYLEHCARNLHDQQKDLNDNYHELQKKLKNQDDKLEKLKGAFEKQGTEYMNIREAYCNAVLAAGMLVWDDETGYKVDLPPEAINLINAINSRAEMDFIEVGDKKHAEDVRNYIGIDERIKRLIPEQKETELHHEIKDQNQEELFIAVLEDSPEKIEKALESGAKISTLFKNETALHIAVLERKYKAAENLLKNGAYVDALDGNLKTPLYDAAKQNDTKMAELLLDNGASTSLCIGKKSIQDMPKSQEMNELFYYHDKEIQRTNHISPPHISR